MAAPTFTSVDPAVGHTGGKYVCKVIGTDFKLPDTPPASGYVGGTWTPNMEIEVNGRQAADVRVYSDTLLTFTMPAFRGEPSAIGSGIDVDIVFRNLGPAEEATATDAFQYQRINLARGDSILAHVVRTMIRTLRIQILDNVATSTQIEYDADTGAAVRKVAIAGTPALAVFGPALAENKLYRAPRREIVTDVTGLTFVRYREPAIDDLLFDFTLFTKGDGAKRDLLNLMNLVRTFFRTNKRLEVDKDTDDPAAGIEELPLWLTSGPSVDEQANDAGLLSASGTFELRAVPLDHDDLLAIERGYMLDDPPDNNLGFEVL